MRRLIPPLLALAGVLLSTTDADAGRRRMRTSSAVAGAGASASAGGGIPIGLTLGEAAKLTTGLEAREDMGADWYYYCAFPVICNNGGDNLKALYYRGADHSDETSKVAHVETNNDGRTWGGKSMEVELVNDATKQDAVSHCLRSGSTLYMMGHEVDITGSTRISQVYKSTDGGDTWDAPVEAGQTGTDWNSDGSCWIRDDADLGCMNYAKNNATSDYFLEVTISDPDTLSFSSETTISSAGLQLEEPQCRKLSSGTVRCLIREDTTGNLYTLTSASDGDDGTWSALTDTGLNAAGRPSFIEMASGQLVLATRFPEAENSFQRCAYSHSQDAGETWASLAAIHTDKDHCEYVDVTDLGGGVGGFLWSAENTEDGDPADDTRTTMRFTRFYETGTDVPTIYTSDYHFDFDSTNDNVDFGDITTLDNQANVTMCMRMTVNGTWPNSGSFIAKWNTSNYVWDCRATVSSARGLRCHLSGDGTSFGYLTLTANQFHGDETITLCQEYDGTEGTANDRFKMWGAFGSEEDIRSLPGSYTNTMPTTLNGASTASFYINGTATGVNGSNVLRVDDFALWLESLSEADMTEYHNQGLPFDLSTHSNPPRNWIAAENNTDDDGDTGDWSGTATGVVYNTETASPVFP